MHAQKSTWRRLTIATAVSALAMTTAAVTVRADADTRTADPRTGVAPITHLTPDTLAQTPALRAIVKDTADVFKHTYAVVAADPAASYPDNSVEARLQGAFKMLPADRRAKLTTTARQLVGAPLAQRTANFGIAGKLSLGDAKKLSFQDKLSKSYRDMKALEEMIKRRKERSRLLFAAQEKPAEQPQRTVPRLRAVIDRVVCLDETDPEWLGQDTILMGGLAVDPTSGETKKIDQFQVDDNFADGVQRSFGPRGHQFASFSLTGAQLPAEYPLTVMLAEKDYAGFADALNRVWEVVGEKVKELIRTLVRQAGPAIAVAIGESAETGALIAEMVAVVLGLAMDGLVSWLGSIAQDDIFPAVTTLATIASNLEATFVNPEQQGWSNLRSPNDSLSFVGHGGRYRVDMHWEVTR